MSAACFYTGEVTHQRFGAVTHKLRYRVAYVAVNLDRMEEASRLSRFLSFGGRGLMSVRARDHGDGVSDDLAAWVRAWLAARGVRDEAARITLLTMPRMFGYVFNPLSVYFIRDGEGRLHHVLYEVNNTFGERHFYLCPADETSGMLRHEAAKAFHVSPFFDVAGRYRFRVTPPGETVALAIRYDDAAGQKALAAQLRGRRRAIGDGSCAKLILGFPLMTLGVIAGIHWEALKLWLKGARYRSRAPQAVPVRQG